MKFIDILKFETKRISKKQWVLFILINVLLLGIIFGKLLFSYVLSYDKSIDIVMRYSLLQELAVTKYVDTILPTLACLFIIFLFYEDYHGKIYETLYVYIPYKYNKIMICRWGIVFVVFFILSIVYTGILLEVTRFIGDPYTSNGVFAFENNFFSIILKSIPTLLFYTIFPIVVMHVCKNIYTSITIIFIFLFMDVFGFLYIYPFGCMWNSNLYLLSKQFVQSNGGIDIFNQELFSICFVLNRIIVSLLSVLSLYCVTKLKYNKYIK